MFLKRMLFLSSLVAVFTLLVACPEPAPDDDSSPAPTAPIEPTSPQDDPSPTLWPASPTPPAETSTPASTMSPTPAMTPVGTGTPELTPTPEEPVETPESTPSNTTTPAPTPTPIIDQDGDGSPESEDCDDSNPSAYPGNIEVCDDVDNDCDGYVDGVDSDGDGSGAACDCDDTDPTIYPGAEDSPYDDIDQDCDADTVWDQDGDGYHIGGPVNPDDPDAGPLDCDDLDETVFPGATEIPYDGVDQDCDGEDLTDVDGDGYEGVDAEGDDCDDEDMNSHPDAEEFEDGKDNDCDGLVDEDLDGTDDDNDGFSERDGDCDDYDEDVYPGGLEIAYDGLDQDCDGEDLTDVDGDSFDGGADGSDCDDEDEEVYPGAEESCDEIDNNCSGSVDEYVTGTFYLDVDGDGYGTSSDTVQACAAPDGYVGSDTDCNDADGSVHPGATELTGDNVDQDCDRREECYPDLDSDGYRPDSGATIASADADCDDAGEADASMPSGDCRDTNDAIHPGAQETCNGLDDNCDGEADEGVSRTFYRDADGDDYGDIDDSILACAAPSGYVEDHSDCDDSAAEVSPRATEVCNGIDDDCDGESDEGVLLTFYQDADGDSYGDAADPILECEAPVGYTADDKDCDDDDAEISPEGTEVCNDVDDNCDGEVDEGLRDTFYRDADEDTYGDAVNTVEACDVPAGYVTDSSDCDDTNVDVRPGGTEVCNGVDDDCNGEIDDGLYQDVSPAVFFYTGSDQTYTVPEGVSTVTVKLWGAAGGSAPSFQYGNPQGGAGGAIIGTLAVTPGETLTVMVGEGGKVAYYQSTYGGGGRAGPAYPSNSAGGGRSAIRRGSEELATAGGGGGGGYPYNSTSYGDNTSGGAGGGPVGQEGIFGTASSISRHAGGGTQDAGGAGAENNGYPGSKFQGGEYTDYAYQDAGGGGGWYGGGSGGGGDGQHGGGGGGSSYIEGLVSGNYHNGDGQTVGNGSDPDYVAGVGQPRGNDGVGQGGDGLVVVTPLEGVPSCEVPE